MANLLILEHPEHLLALKNEYKQGDLFIGLTPAAAYELETNQLPFKTPDAYYAYQEYFVLYKDGTANLFDIVMTLDKLLWEVDDRFKKEDLKPFFLYLFQFKLIIDNIKTFIFMLKRIILKEHPAQVIIVSNELFAEINVEHMHFSKNDPVCLQILKSLAAMNGFKIKIIPHQNDHQVYDGKAGYWRRMIDILKMYQPKNTVNILHNLSPLFNRVLRKDGKAIYKILFSNCWNIQALYNELNGRGFIIDNINKIRSAYFVKGLKYTLFDSLIARIKNNRDMKLLCVFEGVEYYNILEPAIIKYCKNLETIYKRYKYLHRYIRQQGYKLVILNTLAPFVQPNVLLSDICRKINIPCVCWMHGGLGANKSFEGEDMGSLFLGDHYLTYGEAVSRAIASYYPQCSIGTDNIIKAKDHYPIKKLKLYAAGMPFMEKIFHSYDRPSNKRKTIIYLLGQHWFHNAYYMGGDTPYPFSEKWDAIKKIIAVLILFQKKYQIIIKEYPNNHRVAMIKKYLALNGGSEIKVIGHELPLVSLLRKCDLTISTWVSTSFFQAAFSDADQFLYDDTDLTKEASQVLSHDCFLSDNINRFCAILSDYLEKGIFYQKSKAEFREKYLDYKNINNRSEKVAGILRKIINNSIADKIGK